MQGDGCFGFFSSAGSLKRVDLDDPVVAVDSSEGKKSNQREEQLGEAAARCEAKVDRRRQWGDGLAAMRRQRNDEAAPSTMIIVTSEFTIAGLRAFSRTSFRHRDALGEIKDEAEDKFDEDTWFTADEKRNKMTKESIVELLKEYPLPPPFSARVPALQEPANYGTNLETSVYEGQIRSGYRVPMHPFAVALFNHYKMAPGQLVPNGWRKLVGLIYLVQTSGYLVTVDDFLRLYLEVCFIKSVAKGDGWYYIHNRIRVIKGGPKSNKGWHSRYFFIQRPSGKWEFPRKWNGFCKDFEKDGFLAPNAMTKKLLDHIKRRGVLNIDEPLTDEEMRHARLMPPASAMPISPTPY
ncbi:hypothetical protein RJ639_024265 [Escallonia herrerae]|uniref:Transposase (putative) gypsy type domain-containing protein n=1 Tax=Escallonia herrerae TaxID=1293975 RepID=A0AA89ACQ4_9ASTE|nr:hypothetical protein RJ639_024265 [Escallonia herrerae]